MTDPRHAPLLLAATLALSAGLAGQTTSLRVASATIPVRFLPGGRFTALRTSEHLEYDVNTRTSFLGFVQYTNDDQRVDFNLRFHRIPAIGDDVFLVWNSEYTTNRLATYRFPAVRSLSRQLNGAFVLKVVHRIAS